MGSSASMRVSPSGSAVVSTRQALKRHKDIEKMLTIGRLEATKTIKLLLLGAGESGKSTVAKQLRLIHQQGFTPDERHMYRAIVNSNVIESVHAILDAMDKLDINFAHKERKVDVAYFYACSQMIESGELNITRELAAAISRLWADRGLQECYRRKSEYQLNDSAEYFFNKISCLAEEGYIPSDEDIIRARLKTTGILVTRFILKFRKFVVIDVGGQRTERRKWIHCFDDVTAIMFTIALSAYDQKIREDNKTSRISESKEIFKSICNCVWFRRTPLIILFNKMDLFEIKLQTVPLSVYHPNYTGSDDVQEARQFLSEEFLRLNRCDTRSIYRHFTIATDLSNIQFMFDACVDVILQSSLKLCGML
ncbi:guanine nucleotide-binding protein G(o) subunit alpha-like [Diadema antillarum]|uniref:guanine nucleotide-binding protein G(o) subunit alpha-like n=1 Tax=Diadema antillarum TaxID=105358 RepID=UPI003A8B0DA7